MLPVRIDKELQAAIARLAKAEGSTKSSVVCEALLRYIEDIDRHAGCSGATCRWPRQIDCRG